MTPPIEEFSVSGLKTNNIEISAQDSVSPEIPTTGSRNVLEKWLPESFFQIHLFASSMANCSLHKLPLGSTDNARERKCHPDSAGAANHRALWPADIADPVRQVFSAQGESGELATDRNITPIIEPKTC